MGTLYFHIDIDAFFASAEQAAHPEYRGLPVVIGAKPTERGVVAACSYEARRYGIRSAMPISKALSLCPSAVFLPVNFELYRSLSHTVMECFRNYSPTVRQLSIDEASLDMSNTEKIYPNPVETAKTIKSEVFRKTGLTVSVGIAVNKYVAKIASEVDKPDGCFLVPSGGEEAFMETIPLKDLWGVGKSTFSKLESLRIRTVADLKTKPLLFLEQHFGKAMGRFLHSAARGADPGVFKEEHKSCSVSNEETFLTDTDDPEKIHTCLSRLCEKVFFRALAQNVKSRTVFLKIRYDDFTTVSVRETFATCIPHSTALLQCAETLFNRRFEPGRKLRLIGVGLQIEPFGAVQQELFQETDRDEKQQKTDQAVLDLKKRGLSLTKASSLSEKKLN